MTEASSVLIVEDEQGSARLIASLCEELGLTSRSTRSGREAIVLLREAASGGAPFACIVIDIVLEEADGFQVASQARAEPFGAELPIVVVSGVYKQLPKEFAERTRPDAFLPKPFEPSELRETLRRLCKVTPLQPATGDLAETPPAAVLIDLLQKKAHGIVTFAQDQVVRRLYLQAGQIRFAQSNVKSETAGAAQVAAGLIKQASFDRAHAMARQERIPLHEALARSRVLTMEQLKMALKQQTHEVTLGALALATGTHSFEAQTAEQATTLPDARCSPVSLILEWAKRSGSADAARAWLESHARDRMSRSSDLERELFSIKAVWPGESVTAQASSGRSVGELLARVKEAELPLLHALCLSGLIALTRPGFAPGSPAPVVDEDRGKQFSPRENEVRTQLFAERDRLADASHYQVLDVPADAAADVIKLAYFRAAKRTHSDTFSGLQLGNARRISEDLFTRVNEANQVLGSAEKRAEYDVYLDRKAKGLPTDVGAILKAEALFEKGEALAKACKWEDAEAAFREAISHNHAEAEFHAYLGLALARGRAKPFEGLEHVDKALELDPRCKAAQLFQAILKDELGDPEAAKKILRKLLEQDPGYAEAKTELARIRSGKQPDEAKKSGGFFGRLLKKS